MVLQAGDKTPVVISPNGTLTRDALKNCAENLNTLSEESTTRVLICTDNPASIIAAIEACHSARRDLWIAHTNISAAYIREIVERFDVQYILSDSGNERHSSSQSTLSSDSRIFLMTSGTTGRPKIVTHARESLFSRIQQSASLPANRGGRSGC